MTLRGTMVSGETGFASLGKRLAFDFDCLAETAPISGARPSGGGGWSGAEAEFD